MFAVVSDYTALIGFLVGAVVVSAYFASKSVPYPNELKKKLTNIWDVLRDIHSGHIPSSNSEIYRHFDVGDWDKRTQHRVKDTMIVMFFYGAFSLFYCGTCTRYCCEKISYTMTPYGILLDSILIFVYYFYQFVRYGEKYTTTDKWIKHIKEALSLLLLGTSVIFKDFYSNDVQAQVIATIFILCICISLMVLLLLFNFKNHYIERKITRYIDELSCIKSSLDIIEQNSNETVSNKINGILKTIISSDNTHKKTYTIKLCYYLAIDGIQFVSGIEKDKNEYKFYSPEGVLDNTTFKPNLIGKMLLMKIRKALKHPQYNEGMKKAKEITSNNKANNFAQLILKKNEIFDQEIVNKLGKIIKYGISINN